MTEIKTPEQIADDALDAYGENLYPWEEREFRRNVDAGNWRDLIIDTINTDRAQPRDEITVTLPSGQEIRVWIGTSDADGSALVQIDTEGDVHGNVRVFINDSDDPILDENPETGEYEDMSEGGEG